MNREREDSVTMKANLYFFFPGRTVFFFFTYRRREKDRRNRNKRLNNGQEA